MENTWILYQTTNNVNGKIYIGVHQLADTKRSKDYLGSGNSLKAAIKKYSKENFTRITLAKFSCLKDAYFAEAIMVTEEFINRPDTYNICLGGREGRIPTAEINSKISAANKGNQYCLGRILSDETRRKISASHKGKKLSTEHKAKIGAKLKGRIFSDETKKKMGIAQKGHKRNIGRVHSEETKASRTGDKNYKSIAVIINNIYYESANIAAKEYQVSNATIFNRIKSSKPEWSEYNFASVN